MRRADVVFAGELEKDHGDYVTVEDEDGKVQPRKRYPPVEITPRHVALVLEAFSGYLGSAEDYTTVARKVGDDVVLLSYINSTGGTTNHFIRIPPTFTVNTCANPAQ